MISKLLVAMFLMGLCVAIHAGGLSSAMRWARSQSSSLNVQQFWRMTWLFVRMAAWMILLHLLEIIVWAFYYFAIGAIRDPQSAFYFSTVTYTTTGYGDLVLPERWRLVGGVEALTGILMCGWSTGFFFAIVSRMYEARPSTVAS